MKVSTIPRNGLVSEWLLDGNALDTSGSGNNWTATNITYTGTDRGYQSQTGVFNGSNSTVNKVNYWFRWTYTVSFLLKSSEAVNWNYRYVNSLSENNASGYFNFSFVWSHGDASFRQSFVIHNAVGWYQKLPIIGTLLANVDYHITFSYSGWTNGEMKIYLNWLLNNSMTLNGALYSSWNPNLCIGWDNFSGTPWNFFNWNIQSTRIYNRVLSPQEIQSLYMEWMRKLWGAGLAPLTDGLVAYYDFNGDANDIVGGNNGTVSGATLTTDRFGNANRAYSFTWISNTQRINLPNSSIPNTPPFSFETIASCAIQWYSGLLTLITIWNAWTDTMCWLSFGQSVEWNRIFFFVYGRWNTIANSSFTIGQKYHIVATVDSSKVCKLYIDWILQTSTQTYSSMNITNSNPIIWTNSSAWFMYWNIDYSAFYNRVLSASEVLALYQISSQRYLTQLL